MEEKENEKEMQLDSPLIVHKEGDASYQPQPAEDGMTATHTEDELDAPTIERHRFKKKKKSHKGAYALILVLVAAVAVCAALYFTGTFDFGLGHEQTTEKTTKKSYTTQQVNKFEGIITVKGTYLFFEGTEIDGISGLTNAIKYLDEGTHFVIQDENADSNFLNYEVLKTLSEYGIQYDITHVVSSGLISKYETTTAAPEPTSEEASAVQESAANG